MPFLSTKKITKQLDAKKSVSKDYTFKMWLEETTPHFKAPIDAQTEDTRFDQEEHNSILTSNASVLKTLEKSPPPGVTEITPLIEILRKIAAIKELKPSSHTLATRALLALKNIQKINAGAAKVLLIPVSTQLAAFIKDLDDHINSYDEATKALAAAKVVKPEAPAPTPAAVPAVAVAAPASIPEVEATAVAAKP